MKYRPEIDGLRAVAVLPVIFFHAGFQFFQGGFVGVDVFFVISGYLITSIILLSLKNEAFSILQFYERRIRRIIPALFAMILASFPLAWLLLAADEMQNFLKSVFAVSLYGSNILFWKESGYFDQAAELKPLLHTWSLAVEEQYYVFFPVILAMSWKFGQKFIGYTLGILFVLSFSLAQSWSTEYPSAAFYLLPTRVWELLLGAFVALGLCSNVITLKGIYREVLSFVGIFLIVLAVFTYDKLTPFPGLYALLPTIGAALIISFASKTTSIGRLLGHKLFVTIGLLSYSAYLWHQPLFAFSRHADLELPEPLGSISICILTFILAFISWKYVEQPFRDTNKFKTKTVFSLSFGLTFLFVLLGSYGFTHSANDRDTKINFLDSKPFNKNFIIFGDSHAAHLLDGIKEVTTGNVTDLTSPGCLPLRNVDRYDHRFAPGKCVNTMNGFLDRIIKDDSDAVILISAMGPVYLDGTTFLGKDKDRTTGLGVTLISDRAVTNRWDVFERGLIATLQELSTLENSLVVFAIDIPELGIDQGCQRMGKTINLGFMAIKDLVTNQNRIDCRVSRSVYESRAARYKSLVKKVAAQFPKISVFDPTDYFCDINYCKGFDPTYGFLYKDADHLSRSGSFFYALKLIEFLQKK